jgi:tetratricopeptide (TPR) repeat protein
MSRFATGNPRLHRATIILGIVSILGGLVLITIYSRDSRVPQTLLPKASVSTSQISAEGSYVQGTDKVQRGDYQGAIEDYNQVLQINPKDADTYHNRGIARSESGDHAGAIEDYDQALQINPQDADAYYNRGVAHYSLKDSQGAIEDWNQALRINPSLAEAYGDRGFVRAELGDNKGAVADLQQAAKLFLEQGDMDSHQQTLDLIKELQR